MGERNTRADGGIGRRTALKMRRRKACEFESRPAHLYQLNAASVNLIGHVSSNFYAVNPSSSVSKRPYHR